jgi:hypothetical protein
MANLFRGLQGQAVAASLIYRWTGGTKRAEQG